MRLPRAKRWIVVVSILGILGVLITALVVYNFIEYTPNGIVGYFSSESGPIQDNGNHFNKSGLLTAKFYFSKTPGKKQVISYSLLDLSRHQFLIIRRLIVSLDDSDTWTWVEFPLALSGERNLDLSVGKYVAILYVSGKQAASTSFYVDNPLVSYH